MEEERRIEHAAGSEAWLRRTLEEIVEQVRRLLDVTGVAFLVVDTEHRHIRPLASWFASDEVRDAFVPVLDRPYDSERGGVTEAAIEGGAPVRIARFEDWPGAAALHARLDEGLDEGAAQRLWDWYSSSSFLSCPVRTREGRILGVLAIARSLPEPAFSADDLRATQVLGDLAAFALERAEQLDAEERRARDEVALHRASREVGRSLELDEVLRGTAEQAALLSGAAAVRLSWLEPGGAMLREVARTGTEPQPPRRVDGSPLGRAARTGEPVLEAAEAHLPIVLGARVLAVLSVTGFEPAALERLRAFAPVAAAAIANAVDYERERRVAHAMTAGFVPPLPPTLPDYEVGVVYEPAAGQGGGGDVFGIWPLAGGGLALLVGDVSGKGLEVAATAAMVRFFVEARTFGCADPVAALEQANAILCGRLPEELYVPACLAIVQGRRLRWCNAGHPAPRLLRRDGGERELGTTGIPLGIQPAGGYDGRECELAPGDVIVAATDGLLEARRAGVQFGDARLADLLAEHGRALAPEALVRRLHDEAVRWADRLEDDVAVLALRARS